MHCSNRSFRLSYKWIFYRVIPSCLCKGACKWTLETTVIKTLYPICFLYKQGEVFLEKMDCLQYEYWKYFPDRQGSLIWNLCVHLLMDVNKTNRCEGSLFVPFATSLHPHNSNMWTAVLSKEWFHKYIKEIHMTMELLYPNETKKEPHYN